MTPNSEKTELEKKLEAAAKAAASRDAEANNADKTDGPSDASEAAEGLPDMVPDVDVAALLSERDELKDQLLRARAEFENYRKRMAREAETMRQRAAESLIRDLLPVMDNLELALQHAEKTDPMAEGVEMVVRQFHEVLRRAGVEPIPSVGEPFDPNVHDAVMQMASAEVEANNVAQEFQKGYRLGDYVLRPAKVIVSTGAPDSTESNGSQDAPPPHSNTE